MLQRPVANTFLTPNDVPPKNLDHQITIESVLAGTLHFRWKLYLGVFYRGITSPGSYHGVPTPAPNIALLIDGKRMEAAGSDSLDLPRAGSQADFFGYLPMDFPMFQNLATELHLRPTCRCCREW